MPTSQPTHYFNEESFQMDWDNNKIEKQGTKLQFSQFTIWNDIRTNNLVNRDLISRNFWESILPMKSCKNKDNLSMQMSVLIN